MVSRLKTLLGDLILPTKSAFVGGRQTQDNLVIAQEVFYSLKRREGVDCNVVMKLDMNKAYDGLDWDFLKEILLVLGFCATWVNLMITLVSSVTYRNQVSGFLSSAITPHRGLSQGTLSLALSFYSRRGHPWDLAS